MFIVLATDAAVSIGPAVIPALCGVYDNRSDADAYCAWENARADEVVYYVADANSRTRCSTPHDVACTLILHPTSDGEWHWSAEEEGGTVRAYGTDFHATQAQAWNDADTMMAIICE